MAIAPLLPALALLALGAEPAPDALAAVQAALAGLAARTPVQARFTHRYEVRSGEGKELRTHQGTVTGEVAEGPGGLELRWGTALLEQAREEAHRHAADPEARTPIRDGIAELDAMELSRRLDVAGDLRDALAGARVLEDRPEPLDGAPARLLVLRLEPALSARDRKYVKEAEATARLWLGPDGVPLGAERRLKTSGRAFLVITFESEERESLRLARVGDRLVAVRHEQERRGQGAGEKGERRSTTTLELLPAGGGAGPGRGAASP